MNHPAHLFFSSNNNSNDEVWKAIADHVEPLAFRAQERALRRATHVLRAERRVGRVLLGSGRRMHDAALLRGHQRDLIAHLTSDSALTLRVRRSRRGASALLAAAGGTRRAVYSRPAHCIVRSTRNTTRWSHR